MEGTLGRGRNHRWRDAPVHEQLDNGRGLHPGCPAEKEAGHAGRGRLKVEGKKEERQMAPQDGPHPDVMPNGDSGLRTYGLETGRKF